MDTAIDSVKIIVGCEKYDRVTPYAEVLAVDFLFFLFQCIDHGCGRTYGIVDEVGDSSLEIATIYFYPHWIAGMIHGQQDISLLRFDNE